MADPLRHRQTKGAATDMVDLTPPRHIPTLPHDRDIAPLAPHRHDERLVMLVDREAVERDNVALAQRLRLARLRQAACLEDIDYRTPGGLDRSLIHTLASGRWLHEHNNVLILGPTGTGKSFVACALGNQAARDGFSVRYQRLTRLLDDLALARVY